jgi:hypothetical protein
MILKVVVTSEFKVMSFKDIDYFCHFVSIQVLNLQKQDFLLIKQENQVQLALMHPFELV